MTNKTISLQTAKELHEVAKDKGVDLVRYQYVHRSSDRLGDNKFYVREKHWDEDPELRAWEIPAYDTYELLEILPYKVEKFFLVMEKGLGAYNFFYSDKYNIELSRSQEKEPQEALAKLLIYLIKEELYHDN